MPTEESKPAIKQNLLVQDEKLTELQELDPRKDIIYNPAFAAFRIQDNLGNDEVSTGLPLNPDQELQRLLVASQRYEKQGYLSGIATLDNVSFDPKRVVTTDVDTFIHLLNKERSQIYLEFLDKGIVLKFKDGTSLYVDPYHFRSIPILGMHGSLSEGSVRIVLPSKEYLLPTLKDSTVAFESDKFEMIKRAKAELSQFATLKGSHPIMAGALLRSAVAVSNAIGVDCWLATIDDFVRQRLNGHLFGFNLPTIGPGVDYLGSVSTPVLVDYNQALDNALKQDTSKDMSDFIRGRRVPTKFESYKGK